MHLNDIQLQAVHQTEGPLLILAGAGSGKTTTLIHRISHMIDTSILPEQILAVAFTNKAANEMKQRVAEKIGKELADRIWISTFHMFCIKTLREQANLFPGISTDFTLISSTRQMVKNIMDNMFFIDRTDEFYKPQNIARLISLLKNEMVGVRTLKERSFSSFIDTEKVNELIEREIGDHFESFVSIFSEYQMQLVQRNFLDLDDVLLYVARLFMDFPHVLVSYQDRFQYLMIDEYQDTNRVQYVIINMLAKKYQNIGVVGDDQQSIYAFRGSDYRNILQFKEDYPQALVVKLEENYRSTKTILTAANQMIKHNTDQVEKELYTTNQDGSKIKLHLSHDTQEEAAFILSHVKEFVQKGYHYRDIAVFYRNNSDSSSVERLFKQEDIPFKLSKDGGFFEQPEIIDVLRYIAFLNDSSNAASFSRVVNSPKRGIGKTTIQKIIDAANGSDLLTICRNPANIPRLNEKTRQGLQTFVSAMESLITFAQTHPLSEVIEHLLTEVSYEESFEGLESSSIRTKKRNLQKLISETRELEKNQSFGIQEFLTVLPKKEIDVDEDDQEWNEVTLSTVHSAKGLEFPIVFILGMREGSFPSQYSFSARDIEEERRLCYVAFTRAKEELFLTYPMYRLEKENGEFIESENRPSRFLTEFDAKLVEKI